MIEQKINKQSTNKFGEVNAMEVNSDAFRW